MIGDDDISWREIAETATYCAESLAAELADIGMLLGSKCRAKRLPYADAVWDCMPDGTPVGGGVWHAIDRGVRRAYGLDDK